MNEEDFHWNFDVNVFKLLGSQLISDKFTAIIELVKNSYDANATEVKIDFIDSFDPEKGQIIIKDNGLGMTKDDIQNKWMKIGTNSKRNTKYSPEPFKRILLGEKGIGRFAIEKIADVIVLESIKKGSSKNHKLEIDWTIYSKEVSNKNPALFTDMKNKYSSPKKNNYLDNSSGVALAFSALKETWTSTDINRLKRELAKLISPLQTKEQREQFKILVKEREANSLIDVQEYEELRNNSLEYASIIYDIKYIKDKKKQESLRFNDETKQLEVVELDVKNFGPIRMKLYYFNSTAKRHFKKAYDGKELKIDGFKIYRDGVLATPFVEIASADDGVDKYRDILGIDKRRWSNFFGKISSHDFIGFIEINKSQNPDIRDLTNRQDFEDTLEYREFKDFIIFQLHQIEKLLEDKKKQKRNKNKNNLDHASKELDDIQKKLGNLKKLSPEVATELTPALNIIKEVSKTVRESAQEIKLLHKNIQHQEEVFFSLKSLQEYAADIAHMVRNSLDKIIGFSDYLYYELKDTEHQSMMKLIYDESKKINDDVNYMLDYAQSSDKKRIKKFDIALLLTEVFNAYSYRFEKDNINVEFIAPEEFIIVHNRTLLRDVFNNLISNALKAVAANAHKKIIKYSASKEGNNYIILFSDNGIGIPEENRKLIFDRYFTTSKEKKGSGLGLYIVKNNLEIFNATIELIDSEFKDKGTTFKITIPIKEKNDG